MTVRIQAQALKTHLLRSLVSQLPTSTHSAPSSTVTLPWRPRTLRSHLYHLLSTSHSPSAHGVELYPRESGRAMWLSGQWNVSRSLRSPRGFFSSDMDTTMHRLRRVPSASISEEGQHEAEPPTGSLKTQCGQKADLCLKPLRSGVCDKHKPVHLNSEFLNSVSPL